MTTFERVLEISEATGAERCVVCGAAAEAGIDVEMASSGAVIDADSSKLVGRTLRACRACEQRQGDAKTYGKHVVLAAIAAMPVTALAAGLLVDRDDVIGAGIGAAIGLVGASIVGRVVDRRRARCVPLLLLGADHRSMMLQVNVPTAREGDQPAKTPHAPRVSTAMYWAGSLMATIAVCGFASTGVLSPRRTLVIDSPNDAVRVAIDDGEVIVVARGGRANLRVRSGAHRYRVEYVDMHVSETGAFEVGVIKDTLLTTDSSQCYLVWVAAGAKVVSHGEGRVRWTPLEDARSSDRCE